MRILVTGAAGFICGYLVPELLEAGHEVIGIDDFSKYGPTSKSYDTHPRYRMVVGDARDTDLLRDLAADCDQVVAAAGMVGKAAAMHELAYDLLAENERILAATFDAAIDACLDGHLERIVVLSNLQVFESATVFPTPEGAQLTSAPPVTTTGFQKLASEYFARAAWEQYRLPYTILRPSVLKVLRGQDPLHILGEGTQVRHFTYAGDAARGIRLAMESPEAKNNDFNVSVAEGTTILDLAEKIWQKINGDKPFRWVSDRPFEYDLPLRAPDVRKAKRVLGFEATTTLDQMLDEVIPWISEEFAAARI